MSAHGKLNHGWQKTIKEQNIWAAEFEDVPCYRYLYDPEGVFVETKHQCEGA